MKPSFHASCVTSDNTDESVSIGFADREFETTDYLTLQRTHEFSEEDARLGRANVYVERNSQGNSIYGGIRRCELTSRRMRVQFDKRGAERMRGIEQMDVSFELGEAELEKLRLAMRRCFAGFDCFVERAA